MHILPPGSPGEDLFWQARFDEVLASSANPILKGLSAVYAHKDVGPYLEKIYSVSWRAFLLAAERLHNRGTEIPLLLAEVDKSEHPFFRVMPPFYAAILDWRNGISQVDVISFYKMDVSTDFGQAVALEAQSWHDQLREDFTKHTSGLFEATRAYRDCFPSAILWTGKCLSTALHLASETCHHGIFASLRAAYEEFPWVKSLERQRFDCLRAIAQWDVLTNQTDEAITYARQAKVAEVSRACIAHAFLLTASIANYMDYHVWASDQIQTAAAIYDADRGEDCPERRSVVLALALYFIPINVNKAREYLVQYHLMDTDTAMATTHDKRLDAIANITLSRIADLNGEVEVARKAAIESYDILLKYGHIYRASQAAIAVARASKKQERDKWFDTALRHLSKYSNLSDVWRNTNNMRREPAVHITEREIEVLQGLKEGLSNKAIGSRLFISAKAIEANVSSLLHKYGAKNRTELIHKISLRDHREI